MAQSVVLLIIYYGVIGDMYVFMYVRMYVCKYIGIYRIGFPEFRGTFFGGPYKKDYSV